MLAWATKPLAAARAASAAELEDSDPAPYVEQLGAGWRFLRGDRVLLGITIMVAMTNLVDAAWASVLMPVWAVESGNGAQGLGRPFAMAVCGALYFAVTMLPALDPRWREMDRRPEPAAAPL